MSVEKNTVESVGRLVYIEPTEFAEYKIKEENKYTGDSYIDNISWNMEDLQYTVDLQVVCPDRYNANSYVKRKIKSNSVISGSKDWVSFLNGNSLGGENYLTDAYTEITFQEINNSQESQKESLGIDSIDISFDAHFFPLVTMKFTDVRAAALFGPTDYEYAKNARIDVLSNKENLTNKEAEELQNLKNKASSSFFKSLFHFPYPRFMLTVMGYYGEKVTFQLAVNDFKTSFNANNGNFDVTVSFIGYMYGLYTDLPMTLILTAPYYNESYWNSKISDGTFAYNGGGKILKFVEFMNMYYHLHTDTYYSNSDEINEYTERNDERILLNVILDDYKLFESQFLNGVFKTYTNEDKQVYVLFYNNSVVNIPTNADLYEKLSKDVNSYNEKYGANLSLDTLQNFISKTKLDLELIKDNNLASNEKYKEIINSANKAIIIPGVKSKGVYTDFKYYTFFDKGNFFKNLKNKLDSVNAVIKDKKDNIDDAMANIVKEKLGFNPTIENIYRMIFAHIETFFNAFQNNEDEIINEIANGKRTKELLGLNEQNSDIPKKTDGNTTIPPYPLCKDSEGFVQYPGTFYENRNILDITETDLIEKIVSGIKRFVNDFDLALEKINSLSEESSVEFSPITVSDIFYEGKNPYTYLKKKLLSAQTDKLCEKYIEHFFYSRMMMYIISTNKHDFKDFFAKEFENFKKCEINISEKTKKLLQNDTLEQVWEGLYIKTSGHGHGATKRNVFDNCFFFKNPFENDDVNNRYINKEDIYTIIENDNPGLTAITNNFITPKQDNKLSEDDNGLSGYSNANIYLRSYSGKDKGDREGYDNYNLSYITETGGLDRTEIGWVGDISHDKWLFNPMSDSYSNFGISGLEKFHAGLLQVGIPYESPDNRDKEYVDDLYLGHDGTRGIIEIEENRKNKYFSAFLLLGSLSSYFNLYKFCNRNNVNDRFNKYVTLFSSYYAYYPYGQHNQTSSNLFCFPKALILYFGACVYFNKKTFNGLNLSRYPLNSLKNFNGWFKYYNEDGMPGSNTDKNVSKNVVDLFYGLKNIFLDTSLLERHKKFSSRFNQPVFPYRYLLLDDEECNWLEDYFITWVNNGLFDEIDGALSNSDGKWNKKEIGKETNNKNSFHRGKVTYFVDREINSSQDNLIKKLLSENLYIYKRPDEEPKLEDKDLTSLLDSIKTYFKGYPTTEEKKAEEQKEEEKNFSDASEQKKALYYTLKRLYDKWLSCYKMQEIQEYPFTLKDPLTDKNNRKARYTSNADKNSTSEFDSFIFVDSFYRDISDKYLINPDVLVRLIESYSAKEILNSNASVFEFMNEIAEKNSLLFASIPVYNNFYDKSTIENIFTPNRKYGINDSNRRNIPGNTYVLMYTGEASSKLDFGEDSNYEDDGIKDIFGIGHPIIPTELSKLFSTQEDDEISYQIPVFGVTYGKQNQMYFKNISINMDEPKVTDYSIANLIQISYGGKNGDTEGYDVGIGQDIYSIYSNRSYTCTVEMLGCINIMPMMYFQLNNIPMFRGFYMIINVSHSIVPGNMTTKFTGVRVSKNHIGEVKTVFDYQSLIDKVEIGGSRTRVGESTNVSCNDFVDEKIGNNFMLSDFTIKSSTAKQYNICNLPIEGEDWINIEELKKRLKEICETILDPLWDAWVKEGYESGFNLTSGFRSQRTTRKSNEKPTTEKKGSAHTYGFAVDIQSRNDSNRGRFKKFVYYWLKNNNKSIDQFIDEQSSGRDKNIAKVENGGWAHIGFKKNNGEQRGEFKWTKNASSSNPKYTKLTDEFYS